jgi:hypothetical protein
MIHRARRNMTSSTLKSTPSSTEKPVLEAPPPRIELIALMTTSNPGTGTCQLIPIVITTWALISLLTMTMK